ncbi:hypothetical protein BKA70DRAFT_1228087 [Coprinopsis sp. MPI-PUGE-AT-0042]|nr:hypothetical protein BKA70DRAFT_1228087 [Coprinopsis sp. MPI-PUGE-AT-0042]
MSPPSVAHRQIQESKMDGVEGPESPRADVQCAGCASRDGRFVACRMNFVLVTDVQLFLVPVIPPIPFDEDLPVFAESEQSSASLKFRRLLLSLSYLALCPIKRWRGTYPVTPYTNVPFGRPSIRFTVRREGSCMSLAWSIGSSLWIRAERIRSADPNGLGTQNRGGGEKERFDAMGGGRYVALDRNSRVWTSWRGGRRSAALRARAVEPLTEEMELNSNEIAVYEAVRVGWVSLACPSRGACDPVTQAPQRWAVVLHSCCRPTGGCILVEGPIFVSRAPGCVQVSKRLFLNYLKQNGTTVWQDDDARPDEHRAGWQPLTQEMGSTSSTRAILLLPLRPDRQG